MVHWIEAYLSAKVLERVALNGVNAQLGARLNSCEATGNCIPTVSLVYSGSILALLFL